ncbi:MAG TPA: hypothetical protein VGS12_01710 [Caulobacteraceae bacterium]|nr:hypothetical protein [Caulobacteraceae bacterium]
MNPVVARESCPLDDARRERFAHAVASGLSPKAAAAEAGFARPRQAFRLLASPAVARRIAALRCERAGGGSRDLGPLIDKLLGIFDAGLALKNAQALVAARGALVEAARLKQLLPFAPGEAPPPAAPVATGEPFHWTDKEMSDEEWNAHFGPEAPGGKIGWKPAEGD